MSLLRDPLLHFLAAGAVLFVLYALVADDTGEQRDRDRIAVSEALVVSLASGFERTWMRRPTLDELRALVDEHVTEEILYRQALALGLDRDDLVVRRRMRQKMEFLSAGLAVTEPSEGELTEFLREHADRFEVPARWSFTHVFVQSEPDGAARAAALLRNLRAGAVTDPASLGDATLLPSALDAVTAREVADRFGAPFADALAAAPDREWTGPVASVFGLHLVRVERRESSRSPSLAEVRDLVAREWSAQEREEQQQRFYRELRKGYEIELPDLPALATATAASLR